MSWFSSLGSRLKSSFTESQESFKKEKALYSKKPETKPSEALPWSDCFDIEQQQTRLEAEIRAASKKQMTSKDKRNFITATPDSFSETYSMTPARIQMAQNVLKVDEVLNQMRNYLVPKKVQEEAFWMAYFYRVSTIRDRISAEPIEVEEHVDSANDAEKTAEQPLISTEKETLDDEVDEVLIDGFAKLDNGTLMNPTTGEVVDEADYTAKLEEERLEAELKKALEEFSDGEPEDMGDFTAEDLLADLENL